MVSSLSWCLWKDQRAGERGWSVGWAFGLPGPELKCGGGVCRLRVGSIVESLLSMDVDDEDEDE